MKKLIFVFLIIILAGCKGQHVNSDFDYSFARSGGISPIYENLFITGNKANYCFEGQGKIIRKDFNLSNTDLRNIENTLTENKFRTIQEDYNKLYDNITVEINIKKGNNTGSKSDASLIMMQNKQQWDTIVNVFQQLIDRNIKTESK